jgi:hypothetical protein
MRHKAPCPATSILGKDQGFTRGLFSSALFFCVLAASPLGLEVGRAFILAVAIALASASVDLLKFVEYLFEEGSREVTSPTLIGQVILNAISFFIVIVCITHYLLKLW